MNACDRELGRNLEASSSSFIEYREPTQLLDQYGHPLARKKEVHVLGDTHGSKQALIQGLLSLGDIQREDGRYVWKGGAVDLVGLGDMLFDRNPQGFDNLKLLHELEPQIVAAGGSLNVTLANHERYFLDLLLGNNIREVRQCLASIMWGILGMEELFTKVYFPQSIQARNWWQGLPKAIKDFVKEYQKDNQGAFPSMNEIPREILESFYRVTDICLESRHEIQRALLQNHPYILEMLSSMKMGVSIDDTFFVHTNPTSIMMKKMFEEDTIENINRRVSADLQSSLLGNELMSLPSDTGSLLKTFLTARNRTNFSSEPGGEEMLAHIRNKGYTACFYGHTDEGSAPYHSPQDFKYDGFTFVPVDFGAFKKGIDNGVRSVAKVHKDGSIHVFDRFKYAA